MWIMHITICAVRLQWHKMNWKWPEHPSSCFLTTAAERNKLPTGCYFFACLVFSPHDMNVFVTNFTVEYAMTHVQGFSSGILIFFFWETVSDMKESWLMCGSCAQLTCSILLDLPLSLICICIKCPNLFNKTSLHSDFPNNLFHMKSHISWSSLCLHVNRAC